MIVEEILENNLVRHYSDLNMKIRQVETNSIYNEAIDIVPCPYTYVETEEPISHSDNPFSEEIARILMGEEM